MGSYARNHENLMWHRWEAVSDWGAAVTAKIVKMTKMAITTTKNGQIKKNASNYQILAYNEHMT